ncbi:MAG: sigma-70 family RNA polymerase sigma factor [Caldilineaceae bacterium]|nr:sigma-70 family RNA polymerase sigma factor [Caldilineaceae bacterium]
MSEIDAKHNPVDHIDQALLEQARNGDSRAWQQILKRYERLVYSIPLNYGLSQADAADIVQITFTALLKQMDGLRSDSSLGAWLSVVARRHTWRVVQKQKREQIDSAADISEHVQALGKSASNPIERWETLEWINQGMLTLDERCRELLTALYFDPAEPAYSEIAQQLGIAEGSIGPIRARCLKRLKDRLQS